MGEALPLRLLTRRVEGCIGVVRAVDEAEIGLGLLLGLGKCGERDKLEIIPAKEISKRNIHS